MQETPLPQHNNPSTPLHEILFSWGRRLWSAPVSTPKLVVSSVRDEGSLRQQMQKATVQQLATAMRLNGIEGEEDVMLSSLESLALANEISFVEYAGRVQNLFAKTFAKLDVTLRMKVASLALPSD